MTTPSPSPAGLADAVVCDASGLAALLLALGTALDGTADRGTLLVLIFVFALAGAGARLFWDADSGLTFRRQCGFVGVSSLSALALSFLAWPWAQSYPGPLLFCCIAMAMVGPRNALELLGAALRRVLTTVPQSPKDGG